MSYRCFLEPHIPSLILLTYTLYFDLYQFATFDLKVISQCSMQNLPVSTESSEEVNESLLCKHGRYSSQLHINTYHINTINYILIQFPIIPQNSDVVFRQNGEAYQKKVKQEFKGNPSNHADDTPASTRQQVSSSRRMAVIIYPRYNTCCDWSIIVLLVFSANVLRSLY